MSIVSPEFGTREPWFGHSPLEARTLHQLAPHDSHVSMPKAHRAPSFWPYCFAHLSLLAKPITRYTMPIVKTGNGTKNE